MIENNRLKEWAKSHYKEILQTLREEHDFNITDFEYIGEIDHLNDRTYCKVKIYYDSVVREGSMVLVDDGDGVLEIDRVRAQPAIEGYDGF